MHRLFRYIVCLFSFITYSQEIKLTDSAIVYYEKARTYYNHGQFDSSHYYALKSYDLAKKLKLDTLQIRVVTTLAYVEPDLGQALDYLKESETLAFEKENWERLAMIYHVKASKYGHNNKDDNALVYCLKLDSLFNVHNCNPFLQAMNKVNLIHVLKSNRRKRDTSVFPRIDELIEEGLAISDTLKTDVPSAILLQHKADLFRERNQPDQALNLYYKALKKTRKDTNYLRQALIYASMAQLYENKKRMDSARVYYLSQLLAIDKTVDTMQMAIANSKVASYYTKVSKPLLALKHVENALALFQKGEYIRDENLYEIERIKSEAYYALGELKKGFESLKKANHLLETIQKQNNEENILELEAKYQAEKKEQKIALFKSEKELNEQKQRSQRNLFMAGIGLTSMAGLFLFFLFRNRQKTNTKLKELDKVKSNFFANISHEFRTPLTLITNPIEQVLEDDSLSEMKRAQFAMAKQNSERLLSLVNQLLDLSKIDAGQLKLRIQKSNPIQLISALSESFNYEAEQKEIAYEVNVTQNNETVWFDKDALEKITVNLVSNALKYTPKDGSVICSASINNDHLRLEVKNTGKGLTEDEVKHIFQRFYQTSEDNQGTGIGLALVKELVEIHKGSIAVESTPNEWTVFNVSLPVDENSFKNEQFVDVEKTEPVIKTIIEQTKNEDEEPFIDTGQPILLIVEDNADLRTLLKQTFEASYKILSATNGAEGIELALEHIPDIIISDIMMPVKDGIALTSALKNDERTSHIPVILLTAKAGEDNELKGIETGADDYITKPFSSKLLTTKVEKLIESRQLLQQRYSQELVLMPKDFAITDVDEQFLEKVQTILDKNLVESSFSVNAFSEAVGMSRMQLHRKLKALTGLSATEFIRSQRLKLAAHLLKSSEINISQVGYSIGFNDHSYFTKCFKEAYNCTPTEYAKRK